MTETITIEKIDEVYFRIKAERSIIREISDHFTFEVPGFRFTPAFKNSNWDGRIRLLNLQKQTLYMGLLEEVKQFAAARDYEVKLNYADFANASFSAKEAYDFVKEIISEVQIPDFDQEPRDYQLKSFIDCVRNNRLLLLSPTSSGKSFMIYLLTRYYDLPTLVIVDGTSPVHQMADDFISYGFDKSRISKVFGGQDKNVKNDVIVSTWQSLAKHPKEYFDRFGLIIGDEAHHFQAKSFIELMCKTTDVKHKFGFTGTIDDSSKCNVMVLTGLFGPIKRLVTTSELMEQGYVSDLKIKCLVLQYGDDVKKILKDATYAQEIAFLTHNTSRNRFIKNLALSLKGNTLVFFNHVEHGERLFDMIKEEFDGPIHLVHGGVDGEIRNDIRSVFEKSKDKVIGVVSGGTFSTAISIKNVMNIILCHPMKAKIRNLQTIGRILRLHADKDFATLHDIADNLIIGSHKNYTIKHFAERVKIYDAENFKYEFYNIELEDTE